MASLGIFSLQEGQSLVFGAAGGFSCFILLIHLSGKIVPLLRLRLNDCIDK
jgi:hypothetical protein